MTEFSVTGLVNPATGLLSGSYSPVNPSYLLESGRYSPARYAMELCYPRPDSETSPFAYHRIWQTGEPMDIPVLAQFGSFPHSYRILSFPDGWSIGEWLVTDENGDLVIYDWKRSKEICKTSGYNKFALTECINHLPDTNYWHYCLLINHYLR